MLSKELGDINSIRAHMMQRDDLTFGCVFGIGDRGGYQFQFDSDVYNEILIKIIGNISTSADIELDNIYLRDVSRINLNLIRTFTCKDETRIWFFNNFFCKYALMVGVDISQLKKIYRRGVDSKALNNPNLIGLADIGLIDLADSRKILSYVVYKNKKIILIGNSIAIEADNYYLAESRVKLVEVEFASLSEAQRDIVRGLMSKIIGFRYSTF